MAIIYGTNDHDSLYSNSAEADEVFMNKGDDRFQEENNTTEVQKYHFSWGDGQDEIIGQRDKELIFDFSSQDLLNVAVGLNGFGTIIYYGAGDRIVLRELADAQVNLVFHDKTISLADALTEFSGVVGDVNAERVILGNPYGDMQDDIDLRYVREGTVTLDLGAGDDDVVAIDHAGAVQMILRQGGGHDTLTLPDAYRQSTNTHKLAFADHDLADIVSYEMVDHYDYPEQQLQPNYKDLDLLITTRGGEQLTLVGYKDYASVQDRSVFSKTEIVTKDGVRFDIADIDQYIPQHKIEQGQWAIYGSAHDDHIDAGQGRQIIYGSAGNDQYDLNLGDGQDELIVFAPLSDQPSHVKINFGDAVHPDDVRFEYRLMEQMDWPVKQSNGETIYIPSDMQVLRMYYSQMDYIDLKIQSFSNSNSLVVSLQDIQLTFDQGAYLTNLSTLLIQSVPFMINGGAGDDRLISLLDFRSGHLTEVFEGGAGQDTLNGAGGADRYVFATGDGQDRIVGDFQDYTRDGSINTLVFKDVMSLDQLNLEFSRIYGTYLVGNQFTFDLAIGYSQTDQVLIERTTLKSKDQLIELGNGQTYTFEQVFAQAQFEHVITDQTDVVASDYRDVIQGSQSADVVQSRAGNDHVHGDLGDDTLNGGTGRDRLYGDEGADTLNGGGGNDYLSGGAGDDHLTGSQGHDQLYGDAGDDVLSGGIGNDQLSGGQGSDQYWLRMGFGQDVIVEDAADTSSTDSIRLGAGIQLNQLWLEESGQDLLIRVLGASDQVHVQSWATQNTIEALHITGGQVVDQQQIQLLIDAMSQMTPPSAGQWTAYQQQQLSMLLSA